LLTLENCFLVFFNLCDLISNISEDMHIECAE
jgi:hypothetical protein